MSDITLYTYWRSSASWRVRILFALKGIEHKQVYVDLSKDEQHSKEYREVNPAGIVPTVTLRFEDTFHTLYQSSALMEFFEDLYPDKSPLLPKNLLLRQKVRAFVNMITCDIHPLQNNKVWKKAAGEEKKFEWNAYWIDHGFQTLEKVLAETSGKYCFGDEITLADVCLVPQVYNARRWLNKSQPKINTTTNMDIDSDFTDLDLSDKYSENSSPISVTDSAFGFDDYKFACDIISLVPHEIAVYILSLVDDLPTLSNCARVSKLWYVISMDDEVWRRQYHLRFKKLDIQNSLSTSTLTYHYLYSQKHKLNKNWAMGNFSASYITGHADSVYCIQFDLKQVVSGSRDRTVKFWDLETKQCLRTLEGHSGSVLCLQYDSRYIVTGSSDSTIIIWNYTTGEKLKVLTGHTCPVLDVRFNEHILVSCSKDCTVRVWDINNGVQIRSLVGHRAAVNAVHLYENFVVSASGDNLIKLWDAYTGKFIRDFKGHERGLACVQFDGTFIVSGSNDRTIRVWNAQTGECLNILRGHTDLVRTLSFDAERIVSGSYDQTIKVWDFRTGKILLNLEQAHTSWVFHVQIDSKKIISASQDKNIVIWDFTKGLDNSNLFN
ncbi:Glutathione S-transferase zeta-1 [Nowakowskiella sp. JEL0407]|nr:Glutathione S-transferase zeta-1 [Nowakowskiella sp. JEL0407]